MCNKSDLLSRIYTVAFPVFSLFIHKGGTRLMIIIYLLCHTRTILLFSGFLRAPATFLDSLTCESSRKAVTSVLLIKLSAVCGTAAPGMSSASVDISESITDESLTTTEFGSKSELLPSVSTVLVKIIGGLLKALDLLSPSGGLENFTFSPTFSLHLSQLRIRVLD